MIHVGQLWYRRMASYSDLKWLRTASLRFYLFVSPCWSSAGCWSHRTTSATEKRMRKRYTYFSNSWLRHHWRSHLCGSDVSTVLVGCWLRPCISLVASRCWNWPWLQQTALFLILWTYVHMEGQSLRTEASASNKDFELLNALRSYGIDREKNMSLGQKCVTMTCGGLVWCHNIIQRVMMTSLWHPNVLLKFQTSAKLWPPNSRCEMSDPDIPCFCALIYFYCNVFVIQYHGQ